jgi:hypothetical protein
MEASDSGLFHHLGKVAGSKGSREFESPRLRKTRAKTTMFCESAKRSEVPAVSI